MAAITVLIRVENRDIILELEDNSYFTLEHSFIDYCKSDSALANRLKVFSPIFKSKNPLFDNLVTELVKNRGLVDKQHIIVDWCALEVQPSDIGIRENVAHSSNSRIAPNALETLPLRAVSDPSFEAVRDYYSVDEWSHLSKEEKINEKSRLDRFQLLKSMSLLAEGAVFTKCSFTQPGSNKKAQKSGEAKSCRKRKTTDLVPTRKSSRTRVSLVVNDEDDNVDDDLHPISTTAVPLASTSNSIPNDKDFHIESQVLEDDEENLLVNFMEREQQEERAGTSQALNMNNSGPSEDSFREELLDTSEPSSSAGPNKENIEPKAQKPPKKKRQTVQQ